MTAKHPGRTPAQRRALDAIGCGNHNPLMAKATRDALLREGLIVELPSTTDRAGPFTIVFRQFDMPTDVHIRWCEAMAAEQDSAVPLMEGR